MICFSAANSPSQILDKHLKDGREEGEVGESEGFHRRPDSRLHHLRLLLLEDHNVAKVVLHSVLKSLHHFCHNVT